MENAQLIVTGEFRLGKCLSFPAKEDVSSNMSVKNKFLDAKKKRFFRFENTTFKTVSVNI